jgi:ribose transport system ATP-binding protein
MSVAVEFHEIVKSFGPVRVLHSVSFALEPGRIYALIGENGAGKSTLMKILAGYEAPSGGELRINGRAVHFSGSRAAEAEGIVLIHQEFNLAEDLSIAQNIFLGHEKKRGWLLDDDTMRAEAARVLDQVGLKADPDTKLRQLIVAEKQLVEIAKALARKARLLIMDEPTATLTPTETNRLFDLITQLNRNRVTVLYISHKLDEVERITNEVIVMRDGRFVARDATRNLTRQQMANLMVGRELSDLFPPKRFLDKGTEQPLLRVKGLTVPGWAQDVSFDVNPGEILGFAGLVGAGRTELFEGLLGLREHHAESIELGGRAVRFRNPREAADQGLTYLSEDRKGKGLHIAFGLRENVTLMALKRLPFESAPLTKPVAQLKSKGVYVTVVDRGLTDTSAQDAYVAGDNRTFAKISGEYLAKALNGKGDIVVLRGIPTTIDNERIEGFESVTKTYPDIKILDAKYGNWNRDDAFRVMQDYLTRFKHIDAVWTGDDDMSIGVLKAIDQAKRNDIKIVLGGAASKGMIKTLIDGNNPLIQANVTYSPKMIYDAVKMTAEARLKGDKLPPTYLIPSVLVTKENAKEFYFPDSPF